MGRRRRHHAHEQQILVLQNKREEEELLRYVSYRLQNRRQGHFMRTFFFFQAQR